MLRNRFGFPISVIGSGRRVASNLFTELIVQKNFAQDIDNGICHLGGEGRFILIMFVSSDVSVAVCRKAQHVCPYRMP